MPRDLVGGVAGAAVVAFDILKADINLLLKNSPPAVDQQMRVVDMGGYNLGVGIIHRGPTNDKPGDPITGPYHDYAAETCIILSGGGILTTGGTEPATDEEPAHASKVEVGRAPACAGPLVRLFSTRVVAARN